MADEFPTLEIVLAACVAGLAWRGFRLFWAERSLAAQVEKLNPDLPNQGLTGGNVERASAYLGVLLRAAGEEQARAESQAQPRASARTAPTPSEKPSGPPRAHVAEIVHERALRMRRRLQGASARDLLGCAVLGGAAMYAGAADLGVAKTLFVLGGLGSGLLLLSVLLRMRLDSRVELAEKAVIASFRSGSRAARSFSSRPAADRCPACGQPGIVHHETAAELGSHLSALGLNELVRCPSCGHIEGRIRPVTVG
ncbi:MAG TPA: hypothetical protein VFQ61_08060 [Polyangiaceae bacterium]|nr:hypothetical protein [Polyangiaceae bacterium]